MNPTTISTKKESYIQCKKCGTEIYWNTHRKFTYCECKAIYVDGCEDYVRIGGNKDSYIEIEK